MLDEVGGDMEPVTATLLLKSLDTNGVDILTGTTLTRFDERTAFIEATNGEEPLGEFDTVVAAVGAAPADELAREISARGINVYPIGDAKIPRNIIGAVTDGYEIGCKI
jgi:hypothetical protein